MLPVGQLETENVRDCSQRAGKRAHRRGYSMKLPLSGTDPRGVIASVEPFHALNQAPHFVFTGLGGCGTSVAHSLKDIVEHGSQE
mmetsp:Transcript_8677/g.20984  ORF Transcript_8677/g.20984 Transcript_8677/m.20984 type:complete len:85 (-) Transcript_8677:870-1124(-)